MKMKRNLKRKKKGKPVHQIVSPSNNKAKKRLYLDGMDCWWKKREIGHRKKYSHDVLVRNHLDFPLLIVSSKPRMNRQFLRSARRSPADRCHREKNNQQ